MRTRKKDNLLYLTPLMILLFLQPLILRLYEFDNGLSEYAWMGETSGSSMDLFLHSKMVFFECICMACVILLFVYLFKNEQDIQLSKIFYLLLGYAVLALGSTLLSDDRKFGFSGIYEQFESVWCILGYLLIILYINLIIHDFKYIQMLIYALLFGALFIGLIGAFQFIGHDLLISDFFQSLYIPSHLKGTQVSIGQAIGTVYMTLYNPDYVGLYTALVCPVLLVVIFYDTNKRYRILSAIAFVLLVIGTIGANALGGYIGLCISLVFLMIFLFREALSSPKKRMILCITVVCIALIAVCVNGIHRTWKRGIETDIANTGNTPVALSESSLDYLPADCKLDSIYETDDYVEFCYNGKFFRESMSIKDGIVYLDFTDRNGKSIAYEYDDLSMIYTLTESGFEGISSYSVNLMHTYIGFTTVIDGKEWTFTYTSKDDQMSYYFVNSLNKLDKNISSKSAVFTNYNGLFSGRGYIWAKTIPLLKDYLILGSGADTFSLVFPQRDYVSAYKAGYENMIISKPHNLFLQIAVQTGCISLVLLLLFYTWYALRCIKLYLFKKTITSEQAFAIAIFAGTIGFLTVSLVNDSTICVTPIFSALIGIGIVLNKINAEKADMLNITSPKENK